MPTINLDKTISNIVEKLLKQKEKVSILEKLEKGSVVLGDETLSVPVSKSNRIKADLDVLREKLSKVSIEIGSEIVYS